MVLAFFRSHSLFGRVITIAGDSMNQLTSQNLKNETGVLLLELSVTVFLVTLLAVVGVSNLSAAITETLADSENALSYEKGSLGDSYRSRTTGGTAKKPKSNRPVFNESLHNEVAATRSTNHNGML
jgi:uncharacterized membrane protein